MSGEYHVDAVGITVPESLSTPVNIRFDDQRVWSFEPQRDTVARGLRRVVPWPKALLPHLDGRTRVRLDLVGTDETVYDEEVRFGRDTLRLSLTDQAGRPLSVDKSGKLQRTFTDTDENVKRMMAERAAELIADLTDNCGLDAYVTYGSLLGAVRTGHMIGHDSDVDVGYLSHHTHPFDIIRECRATQRAMTSRGWTVVRMSSANFKVWIPLDDKARIGLDVFPSFHIGDSFHVMASKRGSLDRDSVVPLGTVTLEGVELPAPRDTDAFLSYLYGEDWRVPNPAFKFGHLPVNVARMSAWFRPSRRGLRAWSDYHSGPRGAEIPQDPSPFALWVAAQLEPGARVVELGCGNGRDAVYLAQQGHPVTAYDFTRDAVERTRQLAQARGVKLPARMLNLQDARATLTTAARLAHRGGTRDIVARGMLDTLDADGRSLLWRFASMSQRRGGRTFVEFRTPQSRGERPGSGAPAPTVLDPEVAVQEISRAGGRVVDRSSGRGLARLGREDPHVCRLVARWDD